MNEELKKGLTQLVMNLERDGLTAASMNWEDENRVYSVSANKQMPAFGGPGLTEYWQLYASINEKPKPESPAPLTTPAPDISF